MPTLKTEEYQYGDDGLLLNGDSSGLPFIDIESIEGLDSAPLRSDTHDREGTDGGYVQSVYESIRTINIEGHVYADPRNTENYLDALKNNFAATRVNKPFYIQADNGQKVVWGKSQGFNYTKDSGRRIGVIPFQIQILCEDPRLYTPKIVSRSTTLIAVVTTGRSYPKTYPLLYGGAVSSNGLSVTLNGNRETPGKLRIDGPVVNPQIIFDTTGSTLSFKLTVPTGSYLEVDLGAKSVLMNGSSSVRGSMTLDGGWFMMQPGANNFRFLGVQSPATPLATLTVSAYSAWR